MDRFDTRYPNMYAPVPAKCASAASLSMVVVSLLILFAAPATRAQDVPALQWQGAVQYMSGGIGKDEANALKRAEAGFPLTLEFAASGEKPVADAPAPFVAAADVSIQDASGQDVLNVRTDGPLLLVNLPTGQYTVDARWNGVRKLHTVTIAQGRRQHVMFDFEGGQQPGN